MADDVTPDWTRRRDAMRALLLLSPLAGLLAAGAVETAATLSATRAQAADRAALFAVHARYLLTRAEAAVDGLAGRIEADPDGRPDTAVIETKRRRGDLLRLLTLRPGAAETPGARDADYVWERSRIRLEPRPLDRPMPARMILSRDVATPDGVVTIEGSLGTDRFSRFFDAVGRPSGVSGALAFSDGRIAAASSDLPGFERASAEALAGRTELMRVAPAAPLAFVAAAPIDGSPFVALAAMPAAPVLGRLAALWALLGAIAAGATWAAVRLSRAATREARQRDEMLRLVQDAAEAQTDGVALFDADGRLLLANERVRRMFGPAAPMIVRGAGFPAIARAAIGHGVALEGIGLAELVAGFESGALDVTAVAADGRAFSLRVRAASAGRRVATLNDVTAVRQADERMAQAQKLEALGRLAGGLAHDFNNLLAIVEGYGEVARAALARGEAAIGSIDEILEAARRGARLTHELLAFSRADAPAVAVFDLAALARRQASILKPLLGERYALRIEAPDALWTKASPELIGQSVMNLALNARDAMPDGGPIGLTVERGPGGRARLTVSDEGCGMSEAVRLRALEPFFTTKPPGQGTGLGLPIVYAAATQAGGTVAIDSAPGAGTRVCVDLPLAEAPARRTPIEGPSAAAAARFDGRLAVVAEDEPALRRLFVRTLEEAGFDVVSGGDADEALAALQACGREPGLLLTDAVMPGLSGARLVELVRALHPGTPAIALTGAQDRGETRRAFPPDVSVLSKPISPRALAAAVASALLRPSAAA